MSMLTRVTPPAAMPVSLAEAKAHLRVDGADHDDSINALIGVATAHFDGLGGILGFALMRQAWRLDLTGWPASRGIALPLGPVAAVERVAYTDALGAAVVLDPSNYVAILGDKEPAVWRVPAAVWPAFGAVPYPVQITFVAGVEDPAAVPAPIRHAILLKIDSLFDPLDPDRQRANERAIDALIAPLRHQKI